MADSKASSASLPRPIPRPVNANQEPYWTRGWNKCKEQPLVPIGIFATCVALIGATKHLRAGDRTNFNRFLRFRVLAQGVTVAACVGGTYVYGRYGERERDAERLRHEAEVVASAASGAPSPISAAQQRADQEIEELVARAEAMERAQGQKSSARDTLLAALAKQRAEKTEWARQKEQTTVEGRR